MPDLDARIARLTRPRAWFVMPGRWEQVQRLVWEANAIRSRLDWLRTVEWLEGAAG